MQMAHEGQNHSRCRADRKKRRDTGAEQHTGEQRNYGDTGSQYQKNAQHNPSAVMCSRLFQVDIALDHSVPDRSPAAFRLSFRHAQSPTGELRKSVRSQMRYLQVGRESYLPPPVSNLVTEFLVLNRWFRDAGVETACISEGFLSDGRTPCSESSGVIILARA